MLSLIKRYTRWLHTGWPAGGVEILPRAGEDGRTSMDGVAIVGDLTGVPLFKMSIKSGVEAVHALKDRLADRTGTVDLCIVGGGIAGMSAAMECDRLGLSYVVLEANETFSTVANFPKRKPIYAYPSDMTPPGALQIRQDYKEELLDDLRQQVEEQGIAVEHGNVTQLSDSGDSVTVHREDDDPLQAKAVIVAIGRSGKHRRLYVPGEDGDHVLNNLHDPADYTGEQVLVVGGGDSALETAIAIAETNEPAEDPLVTLSYRRSEFSRPKPANIERIQALAADGRVRLAMATQVTGIHDDAAELRHDDGEQETVPCEQVFTMIGREPPLEFFRRSGLPIRGEFTWRSWLLLGLFTAFIATIYLMKAFDVYFIEQLHPRVWGGWLKDLFSDRSSLLGTIAWSATRDIRFWITLLYSACVVGFGIDRLRRHRTPYIRSQTWTLILIQVLPLFLLPEVILPWLDANGWLPAMIKQNLFTGYYRADGDLQAYTAYWHAYGLILAWPLLV
ncbi:MAG: NAD(P)/FAD-dependent oxidoreductase, partial [Planctomycetota bacterium]